MTNFRDVLLLFLIPAGGGIPAGIILAKTRGLSWLATAGIYLIGDLIVACLYEIILRLFLRASEHKPFFARLRYAFQLTTQKLAEKYGLRPGPLSLITLAFSTEPMTGRALTKAAGYGVFTGWALTLTGDLLYFFLILASTLWLNHILGNGTWAVIIVMIVMIFGHFFVQWLRNKRHYKISKQNDSVNGPL